MLQDKSELNVLYSNPDPWGYYSNPDDLRRKSELLAVIPNKTPLRTLDVGCGNGFVTFSLPGREVVGVDISDRAISAARASLVAGHDQSRFLFLAASIFDLERVFPRNAFDLIIITGVLYDQYIGGARSVARLAVDELLVPGGHLVTCHIEAWYRPFFFYTTIDQCRYPYRNHTHLLQVMRK
jgi:SAM-dependent methyltransferase